MQVLWLRYLTEIDEKTREIPAELLENPEIRKAVSILEESAFTPAQLQGYEDFWDGVWVERTIRESAKREGRAEGRAEGRNEEKQEIARRMKATGMDRSMIADLTGFSLEEIAAL